MFLPGLIDEPLHAFFGMTSVERFHVGPDLLRMKPASMGFKQFQGFDEGLDGLLVKEDAGWTGIIGG